MKTLKLIEIWKNHDDKLKKCTNHTEVYLTMEKELLDDGFKRNAAQNKKRIQKPRQELNKEKPGVKGASPSSWPYYALIKPILSSSHYYNPELASVQESVINNEDPSQSSTSDPLDVSFTPPKQGRRAGFFGIAGFLTIHPHARSSPHIQITQSH